MAEKFSIVARLSAEGKDFISTLKSCSSATDSLASKLTSGFNFGFLSGMGQQAFSAISNSLSGFMSETLETSDAMQKLQTAMRFSGTAESEIERIAGATGTLKTYADKTVFSLNDVMNTFGALSANGVADADKLTESVGNAVAVFGGGANEFSSVALAFSQSMAAGKMTTQDWNQVLNASPQLAGGLRKELMKLNPKLEKDFKGAMEKGALTADLLAEAMNNIGMTEAAKEAATSVTTWEGAMGNLEATVQSGMLTLYDSFAKESVISAVGAVTDGIGNAFDWLAETIPTAIDKIRPYWNGFVDLLGECKTTAKEFIDVAKTSFAGVGDDIVSAFSAIKEALQGSNVEFNKTSALETFKSAMDSVAAGISAVAGFLEKHAESIAKAAPLVGKLALAFIALKVVNTVAPGLTAFGMALLKMAGKAVAGLAAKLFGIAGGAKASGEAAGTSASQMLSMGAAVLMIATGVLIIAAGFALLAQSSIALANAGGGAIAVMAGMAVGVAALMIGLMIMAKSMASSATQILLVAAAMLLMGTAVLLIGVGFNILAQASIALAEAGGAAIAVMFGLIVAVAALAIVVASVGSAMLVGAAGFLVFGAAMILIGTGAILAATGILILTNAFPALVQYGLQASVALLTLGGSLTVFAMGATLAGAACVVLAAGVVAFGVGLLTATVSIVAFGAAMIVAAAGMLIMVAALIAVESSMNAIAESAKAAEDSLNNMKESVNIVESGLDALGDKAEAALDALVGAFDGAASDAVASGRNLSEGFTQGMQSGLAKAPAAASMMIIAVNMALLAGKNNAYKAGAFISQGFAQGMRSQLAVIRSAAAQMATAADAALRAKAKIHSPSKVSAGLGSYWGEGFAQGISSMAADVWDAVENLVSIPQIATPKLALAYGGEMSADYDYYRNSDYTISVPVVIDGREVARSTAVYTQEELDRQSTRENRKHGRA